MESYSEDYQDALATLKEDGFAVTLKIPAVDNSWDDYGNETTSTPEQLFTGYGITTQYSAYYIAQGIAKTGDCQLLFCPDDLSPEYLALYDSLQGESNALVFAVIDGKEWQINGASQVKPTTTQILAKYHLTR